MPVKWFVETEEDLKAYIYIEEHTTWHFDRDIYDRLFSDLGHLGLPAAFLCRTNIQNLIVSLAGVENTYYLLADCPDTVEAYFDALSKSQEGYLAAVLASPLQWLNYGDNIHCKILPPSLLNQLLNRLEGRLILGISDELPSDGLLERVCIVRDMVADFNAKR
mgnify:FL=1